MAVKSININENELIVDILRDSSCFMPILEDVSQVETSNEGVSYTKKKISPLFSKELMSSENEDLLNIILNSVPYYCLASEDFTTRDCGTNDVPRAMQTPFWSSWYRDSLGDLSNITINKVYNELGFPFLRDIDILNKNIIYRFAERIQQGDQKISFIEDQDFSNIIKERLLSMNAILNYSPRYNKFLDKWAESEYNSGKYEERLSLDEEVFAYRAQDLRFELTRRKLEGSSEMYKLALRSINCKGSTYQSAPYYIIAMNSEDLTFKDDREIRILNLEGYTTSPNRNIINSVDPLTAFGDKIPRKVITPLYYSSKNFVNNRDYSSVSTDGSGYLQRPYEYLRYNNVGSSLDESDVAIAGTSDYKIFSTLDQTPLDTLDEDPLKTLDDTHPLIDSSAALYNILDIDAQCVLYHRNILQSELGSNYPYVTYPISKGTSLSLLDPYWTDYLREVVEQKSSVNTTTKFGAQLSKYFDFQKEGTFEPFFCIDFVDKQGNSVDISTLDPGSPVECEYIDIYYSKIFYDAESADTRSISSRLITRIDRASCKGLLPFTYDATFSEITHLMTPESFENSDEEKIKTYEDNAASLNYVFANFRFSTSDNEGIINAYQSADIDENMIYREIWKTQATPLTKSVIYGIYRDGGYRWSSPIRVLPYYKVKEYRDSNNQDILRYLPDWKKMIAYYNPYLNFVTNSASPARGFKLNSRALRPSLRVLDAQESFVNVPAETPFSEEALIGPSENVALSNLALMRGRGWNCNDGSENTEESAGVIPAPGTPEYLGGTYIRKHRPDREISEAPYVDLWGDNRRTNPDKKDINAYASYIYANDISDAGNKFNPDAPWDMNNVRSLIHKDSRGIPCLRVTEGSIYLNPSSSGKPLKIDSYWNLGPSYDDGNETLYAGGLTDHGPGNYTWEWDNFYPGSDETNDGIFSGKTICINFSIEERKAGDSIYAPDIFYILDRPGEFSLTYKKSSREIIFKYGDFSISQEITESEESQNIRVGCSVDFKNEKILLVVNNHIPAHSSVNVSPLYPRKPIGIFHSVDKEDLVVGFEEEGVTFGNIYDLRLYTRSCSELDLWILSTGTKRELYSYAPSVYQLASSVYDKGAFKKVCYDLGVSDPFKHTLKKVRIFDRPVWNSILVDLSPVSQEEISSGRSHNDHYYDSRLDEDIYIKNDDGLGNTVYEHKDSVLEQILLEKYEAFSRQSPQEEITLSWASNKYQIGTEDPCNIVSTILYPHRYRNKIFDSGAKFVYNPGATEENRIAFRCVDDPIKIPVSVSHNSLVYKSELGINFSLPNKSWAYSYEDRGTNIYVVKDTDLDDFVVRHKNISDEKISSKNKILVPLVILNQPGIDDMNPSDGGEGLASIVLKGLRLHSGISKMLRASTYYTEMKFPVAYYDAQDNFTAKYVDKWDGIRLLKEGRYYFTCKYPVRILPFLQESSASNKTPATLYATVRLKIEVSGTPREFKESDYPTTDPTSYNINYETLNPEDNSSFPHRKIYIDVYCMKLGFINFKDSVPSDYCNWELIASNNLDKCNADEDIIYLDRLATSSEVLIKKDVNAYFSTSYTASLFKREGDRDAFDVVALPIYKNSKSRGIQENLSISSSSDLSKIVLNAGRTYQLLFDYSGNVVEASFSEKTDEDRYASDFQALEDLTEGNSYKYFDSCSWIADQVSSKITTETTGYVTSDDAWATKDISNGILGDPYSFNSDKDYVLGSLPMKLKNRVYSFPFIPYKTESDEEIPAMWLGSSKPMSVISQYGTVSESPLSEKSILIEKHSSMMRQISEALASIRTSVCGAISAISSIQPGLLKSGTATSLRETVLINQENFTLKLHVSNKKSTSISSNIKTERVSLYGKNLLENNDYFRIEGSSQWASSQGTGLIGGYMVSDGRDVYATQVTSTPVSLKYTSDNLRLETLSGAEIKSSVELKTKDSPVTINIIYYDYKGNKVSEYSEEITDLNTWKEISHETQISSISSFEIRLSCQDSSEVLLGRTAIRKRTVNKSYNGLSDSIISGTSTPGSAPLDINPIFNLVWQNNEDPQEIYPLQFRPSSITDGLRNLTINENVVSDIWSSYRLEDSKISGEMTPGFHDLLNPWRRCFVYRQKDNERDLQNKESYKFYPYYVEKDQSGVFRKKISPMSSSDLFEIDPDGRGIEYDDSSSSIKIDPIYIKEGGESTVLGSIDSNMFIDKNIKSEDEIIYVGNESFSCISNARNPQKYYAKKDSYVPITNVQVLGTNDELASENIVYYEYENLPLIYNETNQHIGINFFIKETQ